MTSVVEVPRRRGGERAVRLSPIKEMEILAARIPGVVSLAQGIPSFDMPEPIRRYVIEKIAAGETSRYSLSPGLPRLRETIAESLRRDGMVYDPEGEIIVTCGAIEALSATLLAILEPGGEVLLPSPTYASYEEVIRMAGGIPRHVPLVEEENFALDIAAIRRSVTRRTRALLYANPNNPTGTIFPRDQIEELVSLAVDHDLLLVSDEVYRDFLFGSVEPVSAAQLPEGRDRVVRIFSFSKAYGMTGWRIGFLHTDRALASRILSVHDALVTCAPVASQYAALAALELGDAWTQEIREEFRARRNRTLDALDSLSHVFDYQKPEASYFVFPRVKDTVPLARDSRRLALDLLERARVAVVPGIAFGPSGEAHLRMSYSREPAEIDRAFERIHDYFRTTAGRVAESGVASERPPDDPPRGAARRAAVSLLAALARLHLSRSRPRRVAIAGLRAKTVMKRWFRELLEGSFRVRANPRSYNTEIGLPLAILGVELDGPKRSDAIRAILRAAWRAAFSRDDAEILVLEMGLRRSGDARLLLECGVPEILVVTPIAPSFTDDLPFLETVTREVRELATAVTAAGGRLLVCEDDPRALEATAGLENASRYGLTRFVPGDPARIALGDGRTFDVGLDAVGDNSRYALLAGVELARLLEIPDETLRRFLRGTLPTSTT